MEIGKKEKSGDQIINKLADFRLKRKKYYQSLQEYENNHNIRPTIELLLEEYKELKKKLSR